MDLKCENRLYYVQKDGKPVGEAKGAVTENYLAVQLACREHNLYYWESNSTADKVGSSVRGLVHLILDKTGIAEI